MQKLTPKQRAALGEKQMQIVKERLKAMKLKPKDLAGHAKVPPQSLTNWRTRGVSQEKIITIATFIQADPEAFKRGEYKPHPALAIEANQKISDDDRLLLWHYHCLSEQRRYDVWAILNANLRETMPALRTVIKDLTPEAAARLESMLQRTKDMEEPPPKPPT